MGKAPDQEVAERVGVDVAEVKAFRKANGIDSFRRLPPPRTAKAPEAKAAAPAAAPAAADAGKRRRV
ncbi:MAG: hypothetical protein FJ102_26120, partial [Deltaproteobacteria bacterium]|nr:hypothetical protein [Deltaproteobacteria bacterium]